METKSITLDDLEEVLINERVMRAKIEGRECNCSYENGPSICSHCEEAYKIRMLNRAKLNKEM